MIREILFRGKLCHSDTWVYGNLCKTENESAFILPTHLCGVDGHHFRIESDEPFSVEPDTIGQFTGMVDKDGLKIFENDVIDGLIVSYCGDTDAGLGMQAGWYLQRDDFESFAPLESNLTDVVSGNIFDNPELVAKND